MSSNSEIENIVREEIKKYSKIDAIHLDCECEKCGINPIIGVRYFCDYCKINLCNICEGNGNEHPHDLLKLRYPRINETKQKFGRIIFDAVRKMKELGFEDDKLIRNALIQTNYDVQSAIAILIEG